MCVSFGQTIVHTYIKSRNVNEFDLPIESLRFLYNVIVAARTNENNNAFWRSWSSNGSWRDRERTREIYEILHITCVNANNRMIPFYRTMNFNTKVVYIWVYLCIYDYLQMFAWGQTNQRTIDCVLYNNISFLWNVIQYIRIT